MLCYNIMKKIIANNYLKEFSRTMLKCQSKMIINTAPCANCVAGLDIQQYPSTPSQCSRYQECMPAPNDEHHTVAVVFGHGNIHESFHSGSLYSNCTIVGVAEDGLTFGCLTLMMLLEIQKVKDTIAENMTLHCF